MKGDAPLRFGAAETTLTLGSRTVSVGLGTALARTHFKDWPPTPFEMENAINEVEDALAVARSEIPAGLAAKTADANVLLIARTAGLEGSHPIALDRGAIEGVFNWLVNVAEGMPGDAPTAQPLEWVATLVILREMMHHWPLASVTVSG